MTQTNGIEWYVAIDGKPTGPVTAQDLALLVLQQKVRSNDLIWCQGLAEWLPVGAVLSATERSAAKPVTHTVHVEAAERRETALRVASLARLYVEKLAELTWTTGREALHTTEGERAGLGSRRPLSRAAAASFQTAAARELASIASQHTQPSTGRLARVPEAAAVQATAGAMLTAGNSPARRLIDHDRLALPAVPS